MAVAGGVVVLPKLLGARSNPVRDAGALSRPVEGRSAAGAPLDPADFSGRTADSRERPSDFSEPAAVASGSARGGTARRIDDLPAASPVAYRPLRVDELPEAPGAGKRGRRGKGGPTAKETPAAADAKAVAAPAPSAGRALRIEDLPSESAAVRPLRNDELNPELVKRADDLLWNHPSPVGVDVPLEVNGKNYIARFAYHYHEFGSAKKPWGYHKGVTLYVPQD